MCEGSLLYTQYCKYVDPTNQRYLYSHFQVSQSVGHPETNVYLYNM